MSVVLQNLRKFVQYEIRVLAYTRMGDGVLSWPEIVIKTDEDGMLSWKKIHSTLSTLGKIFSREHFEIFVFQDLTFHAN